MLLSDIKPINESPQTIIDIGDDHPLNDKFGNIKLARELQGNSKKVLFKELSPNINFYILPKKYFVLDETNYNVPRVIYFVWYKLQNLGYVAKKAACQILVWKSFKYTILEGFAKHIFFDYILPKTGTIVTDYQQTSKGRGFWESRIGNALQLGKYVYYVNFQPDRIIKQITDARELEDLTDIAYGNHQKYKQRRLIITNQPISIPNES